MSASSVEGKRALETRSEDWFRFFPLVHLLTSVPYVMEPEGANQDHKEQEWEDEHFHNNVLLSYFRHTSYLTVTNVPSIDIDHL